MRTPACLILTVPFQDNCLHCWQVMTALSVAKEALQRKEALQPQRLAQKAAKEGRTIFTYPEVGCAVRLAFKWHTALRYQH